jgi:XapX domain-containing protein
MDHYLPTILSVAAALGVGIIAGVVYVVLRVRSPAPPIVALVGLLGIWAAGAALDALA